MIDSPAKIAIMRLGRWWVIPSREVGILLTRGDRKDAGQLKQVFDILHSRVVGEMKCSKEYEMLGT